MEKKVTVGSGINCIAPMFVIGTDANIGADVCEHGASALGTADVPATHCCYQWRPAWSHMAYKVAHTAYVNYTVNCNYMY